MLADGIVVYLELVNIEHRVTSGVALTCAIGWPNSEPRTDSKSGLMHAASTIIIMKPKNQHDPIDIRIPKGTALVAFVASSLMCTLSDVESVSPFVPVTQGIFDIGIFTHTAIESANSPNWREPAQHKSPSRRPCREVCSLSENEVAVVTPILSTYWKGNDCSNDEDEVHNHKDGL